MEESRRPSSKACRLKSETRRCMGKARRPKFRSFVLIRNHVVMGTDPVVAIFNSVVLILYHGRWGWQPVVLSLPPVVLWTYQVVTGSNHVVASFI